MYGGSSYGSSSYGSSSYGSSERGKRSSYGSSYGSGKTSYGSYGYGSNGKSTGKSGKVSTRRTKPRDLTKGASADSLKKNNGLDIADFHVGDRVKHDKYGMGTIVGTQDKGANSVISVDFGDVGIKRLMLRVAPIEKL